MAIGEELWSLLAESIDVYKVCGLSSATVILEDNNCLFVAISPEIGIIHRLKCEPLVIVGEFGTVNEVDCPFLGSRVRGSVQPFEAVVTQQVSAQGIGEVLEVHLPYVLLLSEARVQDEGEKQKS